MDTDVYDRKIKDMQRHIPFLENLIASLKKEKNDKEKEAQLNKMQMLHGILTQNNKRIKIEALDRCESILLKVQEVYQKNGLLNGIETKANSSQPEKTPSETENLLKENKKDVTDTTKNENGKQINLPIDEIDEAKRNELLVTEIQLDPIGTSGKPKVIYFIKKDTKKDINEKSGKINIQSTAPPPQAKPIDIVELSSDDDDVIIVSDDQPLKKPIEKSPNSKAACATFFKGIGLREVNKPSPREQLLHRNKARQIKHNPKPFNFKIDKVCTVSSTLTPPSSFKNGNTNRNRNFNSIQNNRIQSFTSGKLLYPVKKPPVPFGKVLPIETKIVNIQSPISKVSTTNTNNKLLTPVIQNNDELGLLTPLRIENYNTDRSHTSSGSSRTRYSNKLVVQETNCQQLAVKEQKFPDVLSDSVAEAEEEQYQPPPKRYKSSEEYAEIRRRTELSKMRIDKFLMKIFQPSEDTSGIMEMLKEEMDPKLFDQVQKIIELKLSVNQESLNMEETLNKSESSHMEETLNQSETSNMEESLNMEETLNKSEASNMEETLNKSELDSEIMDSSSTRCENKISTLPSSSGNELTQQSSDVEMVSIPSTESENPNEAAVDVLSTEPSKIKTLLDDADQLATSSCLSLSTDQSEDQSMKISHGEVTECVALSTDIESMETSKTAIHEPENAKDSSPLVTTPIEDQYRKISESEVTESVALSTDIESMKTAIHEPENANNELLTTPSEDQSMKISESEATESGALSTDIESMETSKTAIHEAENANMDSSPIVTTPIEDQYRKISESEVTESVALSTDIESMKTAIDEPENANNELLTTPSEDQSMKISESEATESGALSTDIESMETSKTAINEPAKANKDSSLVTTPSEYQSIKISESEVTESDALSTDIESIEKSETVIHEPENADKGSSPLVTTPSIDESQVQNKSHKETSINSTENKKEMSCSTTSSQSTSQPDFIKPITIGLSENQNEDSKSKMYNEESISATSSLIESQLEESREQETPNESFTPAKDSAMSVSSKLENQNSGSSSIKETEAENNNDQSLTGTASKSDITEEDFSPTAISESTNLPEKPNSASALENQTIESSTTLKQSEIENNKSTTDVTPIEKTEDEGSTETIDIDKELATIDGMRQTIREILKTDRGRRKFKRMFDTTRKIEYLNFFKRRATTNELPTKKLHDSEAEARSRRIAKRLKVSKSDKYIIESASIDVITPVKSDEKIDEIEKNDPIEEIPAVRKSLRQRIARTRQDFPKEIEPMDEGEKEFIPYLYVPKKESPPKIIKTAKSPKSPKTPKTQKIPKPVPIHKEISITNDRFVAVKKKKIPEEVTTVLNMKIDKNIFRDHHCRSQYLSYCLLCTETHQFVVCHYVNKHRDYEVYVARLPQSDVDYLTHNPNLAFAAPPRSSVFLYSSLCVFCKKEMTHPIRYWFEHYTMHTGEYTYQCNVCPARRARRNQFRVHWSKECVSGAGIINLYEIDNRATRIVAYLCADCNYIQLHPERTFQHLRTEHNIDEVNESHYRVLILLEVQEHFSEVVDDNGTDDINMILDSSHPCSSLSIKMENGDEMNDDSNASDLTGYDCIKNILMD